MTLLFIVPFALGDSWWDARWKYRRSITIFERSGKNLTDYPYLILVNYTPGMAEDFRDIRFVYYDKTGKMIQIPYWVEEYANSSFAKVWIRIPQVPASKAARVYMYFGNPGAASQSNGSAVFIHYSDWDDNTFQGWGINNPTHKANAYVSNGYLVLASTGNRINVYYPVRITNNMSIRMRAFKFPEYEGWVFGPGDGSIRTNPIMSNSDDFWKNGYIFGIARALNTKMRISEIKTTGVYDGVTEYRILAQVEFSVSSNELHTIEAYWYGSKLKVVDMETGTAASAASSTYASLNYLQIGNDWNYLCVDWILVRPYTDPEPAYEMGPVEECKMPSLKGYLGPFAGIVIAILSLGAVVWSIRLLKMGLKPEIFIYIALILLATLAILSTF